MSGQNVAFFAYSLQAMCFGLFLINAGRQRYDKRSTFVCFVLGVLGIQALFWNRWGELTFLRTVCYHLYLLLGVWVAVDEPPKRRLLTYFVYMGVVLSADFFGASLAMACWKLTLAQLVEQSATGSVQLLCSISYPSYFMPLSTVALLYLNRVDKQIRRRTIILSLLLAVSQTMLLIGMGIYNWNVVQDQMARYALVCEFAATLCQYYVYRVVHSSVRAVQNQMELEQLRLQRDMDYRYYRLAQESAAELSAFRHDFKNQLQVAYSLAEEEPGKAVKLLEELEERLSAIRPLRYCANPIVNTVLTVKSAQAEEQGIAFTVQAAVDDWSIEEVDLSSLFSNLLDNAIEGCRRSGAEHPAIQVKAAERKGFYIVRVTNTCGPDIQLEGTSKEDKESHGLGLSILRSIAQKYQGEFRTQAENGIFTAELSLEAEK